MNTAQAASDPSPGKPPPSALPTPARPGRLRLLAALPIPLLLVAIVLLWVADLRGAYESASLLLVLNFVCSMLAPCFIAYLVARSFLVRATMGLVLLGCGVIAWGAAGMVGVAAGILAAPGGQLDINLFITIHNLCVWLSALCHLAGAVFLSLRPGREMRRAGLWLTVTYTLALGAVGLVTLSALAHWFPLFFVQGQGGTPVRLFVLGSAAAMFVLSAALLGALNRRESSRFVYWYALALGLIAVGLFGIMIESVHAGPLSWTGRAAQFLGGAYMLVAAIALGRQPGAERLTLAPGPGQERYRYAVAIAIVAACAALRLALFQSLGTRAAFITFYPAVMLAVLYGGFRSGLLATVLSAAVANYFWMGHVGHFSIKDPADGLSLAIFFLSCLMISWITDGTRRAQARTAQAEAEARVAVERARGTEARLQKEAELREAQHIARIGSWHWDAKTDVTTGSDELLRIYGFDPASQSMPDFKDQCGRCYPVEDWERVNAAVQRTLGTGAGYELDVQALRDGVPIWVTTRGELVRDADGKIAGLRGTVQDITERKRAEETLHESEDRLRLALNVTHLGTWDFNPVTGALVWDARCRELFGLPPEAEVTYDTFLAGLHSEDRERANQIVQRTFDPASKGWFDTEYRTVGLRDGGVLRWVRATGRAAFNDAGQAIRFIGTVQDITARRQAEADLERARNMLAEGQRIAHLGSWEYLAEAQTTVWSEEQKRIYGLDPAGPSPVYAEMLRHHIHPDDAAALDKAFGEALRGGLIFENENRIVRPDGSVRFIYNKAQPYFDEAGKLVRYVGATLDITERKRAAEALRESERTQRLLAQIGEIGVRLPQSGEMIEAIGECVAKELGVSRCGLTRVDLGAGQVTVLRDYHTDLSSLAGVYPITGYADYLEDARAGRTVTFEDTTSDLRTAEVYAKNFAPIQVRAHLTVPLLRDGKWVANFWVSHHEPRHWTAAEVKAMTLIADRVWLALERKQAEKERDRVFEYSLDMLCVAGFDGYFKRVSPSFEKTLGWSEATLLSKPFMDFMHPDDREETLQAIKAHERGEQTVQLENRYRCKDGSYKWIAWNAHAMVEEQVVVAVARDITERKRADEALRKRAEDALRMSEHEFRSLAEAMPQIVWATRPDGWNIYFNQQWVDYTGMTMEESYGHGWNTPFHPDDKQRAWEAWQRATQHNERYSLECRLRRADGVYRWWLVRGEPMHGANGEILKWFGTCTDIEEIKKAQAALQEANDLLELRVVERTAALQKSQQLLQDVIDGSPAPIFLKDSDGKFLTINTSLEKMLGMARDELKGKTDYDIAPQAVADYWRAHDRQVMETGKAIQIEEVADLPDGHHIFLANKFPLVDATGQIYGVGAISHDITERKGAQERLELSLREKEVMLKEIHHRVKNNLQVISSLVDLQTNNLDDPVLRGLFRDVRNRVRSMALVHEKLYQSDSLAGVDFADYTRSLIGFLSRAHGGWETTVRFKLDLQPVALPVETAVPCGLILNELVTNAFKHAFRGRAEGEVTVALSTGPDGRVFLRVSDDGVGLPAGTDWRKSSSLGLQLIHLLSGQLDATVEVRTGIGTEFLISFVQPQRAPAEERTHA